MRDLPESKINDDEHAVLKWCASVSRQEIVACNAAATQSATDELLEDGPATMFTRTMAAIIARHVRAVRLQRIRQHAAAHASAPKKRRRKPRQ
jgi:hypothetical protein